MRQEHKGCPQEDVQGAFTVTARKTGILMIEAFFVSFPGALAFWFISRADIIDVSGYFTAVFLFAIFLLFTLGPRFESKYKNDRSGHKGESGDCAKNVGGKSNGGQ